MRYQSVVARSGTLGFSHPPLRSRKLKGPGAFPSFLTSVQSLVDCAHSLSFNVPISLRPTVFSIMTTNTVTPTEALLKVAKAHPFAPAVRYGSSTWSYAALWARVRELAKHIEKLDPSQGPVGLHMGSVFSRSHVTRLADPT